ncbi:hypothetical protein HS088_TW16G00432 [Tripterygium wilfordii]|uniref:NAC domain-containing protein n=1 Tax=Tripterygium wilfordii TaxID=458696 RepID=A0A7J7CIZ9_TRIWF|nr:hypothetical protein HS088_TW16G00432 [Tripterygium wilfordii]
MEENLPPGFRFHPTDEELISCYLTPKVSNIKFTSKAIVDVDLNKFLVGMKKTLVFYKGRAPKGEKSNWVMHEYRLDNKHPKEEWVVCRVFQKSAAVKKPQQETTSSQSPSPASPYDTNSIVNEFGDSDQLLPNSSRNNNLTNISYNPSGIITNNSLNMNMNMSMDLWGNVAREAAAVAATTLPSLSWPPPHSLLSSNLSMNSLLLKAMQLRTSSNYQASNAAGSSDYSFMQQGMSQFGNTSDALTTSNFQASSSSSKALELPQEQQQQQQEQPFNLDSIW